MPDEVTREWVRGLGSSDHHLLNAELFSDDIRRLCRAYLSLEERCRKLEKVAEAAQPWKSCATQVVTGSLRDCLALEAALRDLDEKPESVPR